MVRADLRPTHRDVLETRKTRLVSISDSFVASEVAVYGPAVDNEVACVISLKSRFDMLKSFVRPERCKVHTFFVD